jgi:glyoxalase family protein
MTEVHGLHHITAIAGDAQENLDFYVGLLGMRLVKKSVNQDDPGTYHLFYADAEGNPGTDLTFFPWPGLGPGRKGHGLATSLALAVPRGTLSWWRQRLEAAGTPCAPQETRFGEPALPFTDPHGLDVALVESEESEQRAFAPWPESPVPEGRQVRGLHGARLEVRDLSASTAFLGAALGYRESATEGPWHRCTVAGGGSGCHLDLRELPGSSRGAWGVGAIHHLAFRVADDEEQLETRTRAQKAGTRPTPVIDRFWFRSVYFREPGGVLFELATDGPGFAIDEAPEKLGETLVLPPWLEEHRSAIEQALPRLASPAAVAARG